MAAEPVGAPLPAAPFQCAPEGGGCQPVALGKALGVGLRVLGYAAVSAETCNPLMASGAADPESGVMTWKHELRVVPFSGERAT